MSEIEELIGIQNILEFALIFFLAFIGSFAKTYLKMLHSPDNRHKINFIEVILSTFTATIFVFTFSTDVENKIGIKGLMLVSFLGGLVGFELLVRISSLQGLMGMLSNVLSIYNNYKSMDVQKDNESKEFRDDDDVN